MAIKIKGLPNQLTPLYNEVNFYVDSTNKIKAGFRYLFKLVVVGSSTQPIFKAPPRPVDGFGVFKAAEALQCLASYDIKPENLTAFEATNSRVLFDVKMGEEYLAEFPVSSWAQQTTGLFTGKVNLTGLTGHTFIAGNQIQFVQNDGGVSIPTLEGLFTVLQKTATTVTIDLNYYLIDGLTPVAGKVYYSDMRKIQFLDLRSEAGYVAFNGAYNKDEYNAIDWEDYKMGVVTGAQKFITGMPNNFRLNETQHAFFNIATIQKTLSNYLEVINSNGDVFKQMIGATGSNVLMQVPVSPASMDLTLASGTFPLIKDDTEFYTIRLKSIDDELISELRTFYVNRKCNKKDITLDFVDSKGAIGSFNFPLKAELKHDNTKERAEFEEGDLDTTAETFKYYDLEGGEKVVRSQREQSWILTTDWLTNAEMLYFNELIDSPCVIMCNGFEAIARVDVVTTGTITPHPNKKKLTNRTIEVKFSKQTEVNI